MPVPLRPCAAILALTLAGCSAPTQDQAMPGPTRVVEVSMVDLAFAPPEIQLVDGEQVVLRFTNDGATPHDAFIGDEAAQADHAEEMSAMAEMDHGSDDVSGVTVQPGEAVDVPFTAAAGGTLVGCHQPGHYDAGMVLEIAVR